MLQIAQIHAMAVEYDPRRKADHHPIDPQKEYDEEGQRAVQPLLIGEVQIDGKGARGDEPSERGEETAEEDIVRLAPIGTNIGVERPCGEKAEA